MAHVNSAGLIAMSVVLDVLAVGSVILRFVARRQTSTPCGADDWLILAAVVFSTGFAVMEIYGAVNKIFGIPIVSGANPTAITSQFNQALRIEMVSFHLSIICMSLVRLSLAFLYRRVFATPKFTRVLNIWIIFLVLYLVAFEVGFLAICRDHLVSFWNKAEDYTLFCKPSLAISQASVCTNMFLDLVTIVLPVPMIWSLSLTTRRRFQLVALFAAALLSLVCSITKAGIYIEWTDGAKDENPVTTLTIVCVLMYIEMQIGVIAACAPLLRRMVPRNLTAAISDKIYSLSHKKVHRCVSTEEFVPNGSGEHKSMAYRVSQRKFDCSRSETLGSNHIWVDTTVSVETNTGKWDPDPRKWSQ